MELKSERWKLNSAEWIKISKSAGIALGGAALVIIGQVVLNLPVEEMYIPILTSISSVLINIGRKLYDGESVNIVE